ncbi:MAG: LAGLIDADG family homing endonuclease [Thermoproteota archaeon]
MKVLLIPRSDMEGIVSMREIMDAVEAAFKAKALGRAQMPSKTYVIFSEGDFRTMPCYIPELGVGCVKIVNSHPGNPERYGMPAVMAIIVLIEPETGRPLAVMDGTYITNMRTGAAGGIAAKYLARKDSRIIGMIGAGAQARTQLLALNEVFKIEEVRVCARTMMECEKFAKDMEHLGLKILAKGSVEETVRGCDILVTTTPVTQPIVKNEWISEGMHINAIGADACYSLDTEIMTPDGFISVGKIKEGMTVWSANPNNGLLEKADVIKMHFHEFNGNMIHVRNLYTDFLVTSNHNIPSFSRDGRRFLGFVKASELTNRWQTVTTIKVKWKGVDRKTFILPKIKKTNNYQKEYSFKMKDWMEFLGWFISEGSLKDSNYGINIYQKDKEKSERIRKLLARMGLHATRLRYGWSFGSKQIYEYLKNNVGKYKHEKRIPKELLELDKKYLIHLFNSLVDGDGWRRKTKRGKERCAYSTTSKILADNVIELAIKLGRFCTVGSEGKGRMSMGGFSNRKIKPIHPVYIIQIGAEKGYATRSVYRRDVNYVENDSLVACPQLDKNHILIIKRNGRITMNGNSGKEELDPTILRRAKIVVDDYEQAMHSGEINVPISQGVLRAEQIYAELGEIIAGLKGGRANDEEITVFDSTGLAIQDLATAALIYRKISREGKGIEIDLL